MRKLSLAEKILSLVSFQFETKQKCISESKLKALLGNPPKSTYYRVLKMLIDGGIDYRPLLKEPIDKDGDKKFPFYFEIKR